MAKPGRLNLITDVDGLAVGNATDEAVRTGATVLVCPGGWTAAADVRGGAPGERDIAALALEGLVGRVDAIVLSGGSVFGLAAADGVTSVLSRDGVGLRLHPDAPAIPITPAAVLYDLANGGDKAWGEQPPYRRLGVEALANAERRFALGAVGAGRGAQAGLEPGGLGSASVEVEVGLTVGALAAVNPIGSVRMPDGETFWAWPFEMAAEFGGRAPGVPVAAHDPTPIQSRMRRRDQASQGQASQGQATTLAIVAVSAELTATECKRVAIMAHDGMARAIRPCHTPFDGDIVFVVAKGAARLDASARAADVARIGSAAADCLARAIARGVYAAQPSAG